MAGADAQSGVENQQRLAHRIDDVLGVGLDGLQIRPRTRRRSVTSSIARTSNSPWLPGLELASVEQHHATPDDREGVLQLKVVEDGALGNDVFEQRPQVGDVPLAVAQLVNQAVLGFFGGDVKGLIESAVGGADAQGGVEHQQRLAHRVDDVLGVRFDVFNKRIWLHRGPISNFA